MLFLSLRHFKSALLTVTPSGMAMYISSSKNPLRNAVFTSIWWMCILYFAAMARTTRIDVNRTTGAKVSLKSWPGICWNPRATSLALYRSRFPCSSVFLTNTQRLVTMFLFEGVSTTSHTWFFSIDRNSSSMADSHWCLSLCIIACL